MNNTHSKKVIVEKANAHLWEYKVIGDPNRRTLLLSPVFNNAEVITDITNYFKTHEPIPERSGQFLVASGTGNFTKLWTILNDDPKVEGRNITANERDSIRYRLRRWVEGADYFSHSNEYGLWDAPFKVRNNKEIEITLPLIFGFNEDTNHAVPEGYLPTSTNHHEGIYYSPGDMTEDHIRPAYPYSREKAQQILGHYLFNPHQSITCKGQRADIKIAPEALIAAEGNNGESVVFYVLNKKVIPCPILIDDEGQLYIDRAIGDIDLTGYRLTKIKTDGVTKWMLA